MKRKKYSLLRKLLFLLIPISILSTGLQEGQERVFDDLEKGFKTPPDSIQTSVYWYWISDNISKVGVVKDLQAMKAVGINRAFIGNIGLSDGIPYGNVKLFSDEWWDILHTALKTATELNIEIGIFNSPGWSQSGGPWVKPEQAMRYLASSETLVKGPGKISQQLSKPPGDFQDVKVIAFPAPKDYDKTLDKLSPLMTSIPKIEGLKSILDHNNTTGIVLPAEDKVSITFALEDNYTARSLTIHPLQVNMNMDVQLDVLKDGKYLPVKNFKVDRSNNALNVGFEQYAPVIVSFNAVGSSEFRLTMNNFSPNAGIAEVEISSVPKVERFKEKTLAKMHPTPLPYWHDYQWERQPEIKDEEFLVKELKVQDITSKLTKEGILNWEVPPGEWVVLRTGMVPTGVENGPASPEGTGLEVDKLNHEHVIQHFDAFLGEIQRRIPAEDRKTWKVAVQDSYEMGGQNWTDNFVEKFKTHLGYDPTPYIPVMYGHVVGSQDKSDRFLWDLRRFVADKVAYEYVAGLRDISHKHGLTIWLENYGHWGFPGEFLQYGGQSDEIAGEFWSEGDLGNIENRAASSAAHIYGKNKVSAESFTAAGNTFGRYPAMMKQRGDRFFTEGINNTLLHVYIQQPYEDRKPGVNAWFGNEFNRFNTWFYDMDMFIEYLKRSNYMLQQGNYIADVAYFIGEDVPKMTGVQDPALPQGYSFDYINAEVIEERLSIKDGRFVLPDGMSYRVLVLPKLETMRPELLQKIEKLVKEGGVVLGPKPNRSPSLGNYRKADEKVQKLAKSLWGNIDGESVKVNKYGKGLVMNGITMQEAFDQLGILADVKLAENDPALFIHRRVQNGEIYFVSNQSDQKISIHPEFRVNGKLPELWDATTGRVRSLPEFTMKENTTVVPLKLDAYESAFIVFRKPYSKDLEKSKKLNFPSPLKVIPISGSWKVDFDEESRGPKEPVIFETLIDWAQHPDTSIAHYSGTAYYHNNFSLKTVEENQRVYVDLGSLTALAKVKVNGKEIGGVWTAPYKVDISDAVREGDNQLEIKIVNTWLNRLIGDLKLPEDQRKTWTFINPYNADSPLQSSGLKGPVLLEVYPY